MTSHLWCHTSPGCVRFSKLHTSSHPPFTHNHTQSTTSHFFMFCFIPLWLFQLFHSSWFGIAKPVIIIIIVMPGKIWLSVLSVSAACTAESSNSRPKSVSSIRTEHRWGRSAYLHAVLDIFQPFTSNIDTSCAFRNVLSDITQQSTEQCAESEGSGTFLADSKPSWL